MTSERTPFEERDGLLTDAWLDAAFAATREVRIRRLAPSDDAPSDGPPRRRLVLVGEDVAQLRWMLRLAATGRPSECAPGWSIELRNTRSRVALVQVHATRFLRAAGLDRGWAEVRDGETLARWLHARGFDAPFEAWKSDRGCVRSPRP